MNVLVTGASGFVGSYLCPMLHAQGYGVFPVIRGEGRYLPGIPSANHRIIPAMDGATDWSAALAGMDIVINLAARVHVMNDISTDPLQDFRIVNVDGVMNLARQASAAGVRQLIQISSIKVNGEQTFGQPFSAHSTPAPQDPYGISKFEAEQGLFALAVDRPMAVTVIRPPLVYGGQVKGNLEVLASAIRKGIPLPFRWVKNRRSMVSLYNLCDLIRVCIGNPQAFGQLFLVADDRPVSTAELVARMAAGLARPERNFPVPPFLLGLVLGVLGKKDMAERLLGDLEVDIWLTTEKLGWHPPFTVEQSFTKMFVDN